MRYYCIQRGKIKKFEIFRGNLPNPEVADPTRTGPKITDIKIK